MLEAIDNPMLLTRQLLRSVIHTGMTLWPKKKSTVTFALTAVARSVHSAQDCGVAVEAKGFEFIAQAMAADPGDTQLQEAGVMAVESLLRYSNARVGYVVRGTDIIRHVATAMLRHPGTCAVQRSGSWAIIHVVHD